MQHCPLKIAFYNADNKDRVAVIKTSAVVYRRSDGTYYVRLGKYQFTVKLSGHGFRFAISTRNWFLCFPQESKDLLDVTGNEQPRISAGAFGAGSPQPV